MADEDRNASDAKAKKKSEPGRSGLLSAGLALMLAAIALIATGYLWYSLLHERPELLDTDVVGNLEKLQNESTALRTSVSSASTTLDELRANQDSIRAALDQIQNELSKHRTDWVLAESEQLLIIANNRLQLARDVRSALAALRAADAQLNQISNPSLLPVRREIAREIAALEAIDKVDVGGISLKLGSLAETVDRLPVAPQVTQSERPTLEARADGTVTDAAADANWRRQARDLWQDMLSLVRIRTDVGTPRPLLPPEQQYFLRENLKLMLFSAQAALLQGNAGVFQQNIKAAQQLLKDYFDEDTQVVAGAQAELDKMRNSKLVAELPDISRSLTALRAATGTGGGARSTQ